MEEFFNEVTEYIDLESGLGIAYLIVCVLVLVMAIVASVMKLVAWIRYRRANKMPISVQMSGLEAARYVLDKEGLDYVNVRKAGFLREAVFGNYYNIATKTIYLRSVFGKIDDKQSVTSVALGVQKAAIAKLCESGDRQAVTRNKLHLIGLFGPFLFIPLVILGMILDFMVFNTNGIISTVCLGASGLFVVIGFIVTFLNIPVEKRANEVALQMMEDHGLATGEELETMRDVYKAYITSYICDFILELLRMIQWILEILMKAKGSKSK
ncbi:MAG: zinc metallopeptidase [Firmicutes bacterium]|nr:zinc metallopeptidase [Bacillota bacterium]